ncbi:winged helix-turn-helix transcriptional regulator [Candidatus Microgenomates bacterium]|nr:winged helix-turn-helix transcriptional regulator [Candidatus Microgenomates bacterium]
MVNDVEGLARRLYQAGYKAAAEDLRGLPQRHDLPEKLPDDVEARLGSQPRAFKHELFTYDADKSQVFVGGKHKKLSPNENKMLLLFWEFRNMIISARTLTNRVFGPEYSTKHAKTYVSYLRKKIEPDPKEPQIIITVRGAGYYLADMDIPTGEID